MPEKNSKKSARVPFRQLFIQLLEQKLPQPLLTGYDSEKISLFAGTQELTASHIMAVVMLEKAMRGDAKAFEFIRDIIGEKPKDKPEVNAADIPKIQIRRMGREKK